MISFYDNVTDKRHDGIVTRLEAYEAGKLSQEETFRLFQELIDTGLVYQMSQEYQKRARSLVEVGICTLPAMWN